MMRTADNNRMNELQFIGKPRFISKPERIKTACEIRGKNKVINSWKSVRVHPIDLDELERTIFYYISATLI